MSKLANKNKYAKLIKALQKAGFQVIPGGRHTIIANQDGDCISTVPNHREVNVNTLRAILKQCGLSEDRYIDLY